MGSGFRKRLFQLVRSERGMALPTAMFATVASLGLAGAAVMSSVDVQRGSQRDSGSKSAIAAADAGANVAMLRLNREREDLAEAPCLDGAQPAVDGWCPAVAGSVGTATYSYRVSDAEQTCGEFDLCVSVTGTAGEVSRRVLISFNQGASGPGGSGGGGDDKEGEDGEEGGGGGPEGLIGKDKITITGSADVRVNMGTNGNVEGTGGGFTVCGNIRRGIGKTVSPAVLNGQCDGYEVTEENVDLPPVTSFMPADIATNNSNGRITKCTKGLPAECQMDGYSGNWSSQPPFDTKTRRISMTGNKSLTLSGGDYWICALTMTGNQELIMKAGSHVRLFFDTPENCGTTSQLTLTGNIKIKATGYDAAAGVYELPGFFFLGSTTTTSSITLTGNSGTNELVVYAPNTNVTITGSANFKGLFAGKSLNLTGSGTIENDDGFVLPPWLNPWPEEEPEEGEEEEEEEPQTPGFFTPQFYVECTGAEAPAPDANC